MDLSTGSARLLALGVLALAAFALIGRFAAPSDLWDQTQPRTLAYTADMLARGGSAWILARDAGDFPATKPPLVNWLAAPATALFGRSSEIGYRLPSILAAAVIVLLLVRTGERVGRGTGWLSALCWIACYATFKLFALVRPDMLVCLICFIGWLAAVRALAPPDAGESPRARDAFLFWSAAILAAWTKGPVAILLPLFAIAAALLVHRSLRPLLRLRPIAGSIAFLFLAPAWYLFAAMIDAEHVFANLLGEEVLGRVTGLGAEGGQRGPTAILLGLPVMPLYALGRFAPWSFAAVLAALALLARPEGAVRRWRSVPQGSMLLLACVWALLVIALFSLSSGKRADYVAPAFALAALAAAWWLLADRFSPLRFGQARVLPAALALLFAVAAGMIITFTMREFRGPVLDEVSVRRFDEITRRTREAKEGPPIIVVMPQLPHFAVLLGEPPPAENTLTALQERLAAGESVRALIADAYHPAEVAALLERPDARILFEIEHGPDALRLGYSSPVRFVRFGGD